MRKLFALSALTLSLVACTGQQAAQSAPTKTVATVLHLPSFEITVRPHDSTIKLNAGVTTARYCVVTSAYKVCNNMYPNGPERHENVGAADGVLFSEETLN